jgi:hypothetical protein
MVVSRRLERSFKKYFGPDSGCQDSGFRVIIPLYSKNPKLSGCPGSGDDRRCRRSVRFPEEPRRKFSKDIFKAMSRAFGPPQMKPTKSGRFNR